MVERTASGTRDTDGVHVTPDDEHIPYLNQWVRDYVDKRRITNSMPVLVADVAPDDADVRSLTINSDCASDRAQREADKVDTITVTRL